jgi:hypothetical protein
VPYISDAKRERARWMTLKEAVAHVTEHDGCDRRSAWKQLRAAVGDRKILVRWEDQKPSHASQGGLLIPPDWPPEEGDRWEDTDGAPHIWDWQRVPIRGAKVFDPFTQRDRVLLLSRLDVQQIWPEQSPAPPPPPEASRPQRGRPRKLRDKVKELLLDRNVDLTMLKKAIAKYVRDHWNEGRCPSDRTIVRAIKAAREATTQG